VQSQLVASAAAGPVAKALCDIVQHRQLYLADLDAIAGAAPDWNAFEQIIASGAEIIIDTGVATPDMAQAVVDFADRHSGHTSIVVALESSASPDDLPQILSRIGAGRAIFSLDLKHGRAVTKTAAWQGLSVLDIASVATAIGFERMIVLDVAAVGVDKGPQIVDLCRNIRARHPKLELISGGGVRSIDDLKTFHKAGCDGVLVASALHDGKLTRSNLQNCDVLRK
jgi:phosphoribosylformimino-5-aminoimidazole carboxamide ribotide isomerase